MKPDQELDQLLDQHPLPGGFSIDTQMVEDIEVAGHQIHVAGLMASCPSTETHAVGAAASIESAPVARAFFELSERISTMMSNVGAEDCFDELDHHGKVIGKLPRSLVFPPQPEPDAGWRASLSSGVALHTDRASACLRALLELYERHAAMAAWIGAWKVEPLHTLDLPNVNVNARPAWLPPGYQLQQARLSDGSPNADCTALAILATPAAQTKAPLLFTTAAGTSVAAAKASAESELLQRLAFLWGETTPSVAPSTSSTPDFHQDYYQVPAHHARLVRFMDGQHCNDMDGKKPTAINWTQTRFADISAPGLSSQLTVVKAVHPAAHPLRFGLDPICEGLEPGLRVHPIC